MAGLCNSRANLVFWEWLVGLLRAGSRDRWEHQQPNSNKRLKQLHSYQWKGDHHYTYFVQISISLPPIQRLLWKIAALVYQELKLLFSAILIWKIHYKISENKLTGKSRGSLVLWKRNWSSRRVPEDLRFWVSRQDIFLYWSGVQFFKQKYKDANKDPKLLEGSDYPNTKMRVKHIGIAEIKDNSKVHWLVLVYRSHNRSNQPKFEIKWKIKQQI